MFTKQQLIGAVVALVETNDLQALNVPGFLVPEFCHAGDVPLVMRMAAIVGELWETFDYAKSPEFLSSIEGKSESVRAMRLKMITPERRSQMFKRLGDALARVMDSDDILALLDPRRHER